MGTSKQPPSLVDVAVPYPVDKLFTYRVPEALRGRVQPAQPRAHLPQVLTERPEGDD